MQTNVVFLKHHRFMIGIWLDTWLSVFMHSCIQIESIFIHPYPSIRLYVHSTFNLIHLSISTPTISIHTAILHSYPSILIYSIHPSINTRSISIHLLVTIHPSILHPSPTSFEFSPPLPPECVPYPCPLCNL